MRVLDKLECERFKCIDCEHNGTEGRVIVDKNEAKAWWSTEKICMAEKIRGEICKILNNIQYND